MQWRYFFVSNGAAYKTFTDHRFNFDTEHGANCIVNVIIHSEYIICHLLYANRDWSLL